LKLQYPDDETMQVSHETIYRSLFIQARGVLKAELMKHLRTRRIMRRSKKASAKGQPRGQIIDAVSIRERPAEAEDRAIPGHWEGDLLSGSNNTHIARTGDTAPPGSPLGDAAESANRLRIDFPDDESMRISHKARYQALYIQDRGG
jgi:IS30 family transposase